MDQKEKNLRRKLRDDFVFYAPRCLRIKTKSGKINRFSLNDAQMHLHEQAEKQLKDVGRVRLIILKGRQQGISTYVEGRFYWKVSNHKGLKAFILTHLDDATNNVFTMSKRYHDNCPPEVKPSTASSNAKELVFDRLDSGYKVGTAGSKGVGRSETIQLFHGSEVAYWPHAEEHTKGALQAVSNEDGTEIFLESTSNGANGVFYEMCKAAQRGEGEYRLVFIPWFWQKEYRLPVGEDFKETGDELDYKETYNLDSEQIAWRRAKIAELRGVHNFRREYPATVEEAFKAETVGALWRRETIDNSRVYEAPELIRIVVAIDPAVSNTTGSDETGIVAAGKSSDGHIYVLKDRSGRKSPAEWAKESVALYNLLKADRIIGESNQGGDLVERNIRVESQNVPVKLVHASRGKVTRAEPVAALYETGKVHHVGTHMLLEDQMVQFKSDFDRKKEGYSPDRVDALVWAITELGIETSPGQNLHEFLLNRDKMRQQGGAP